MDPLRIPLKGFEVMYPRSPPQLKTAFKLWRGNYTSGAPVARYDGPDSGGAAAAVYLLFLG